jgi:hypothetical protein
LLRARGAEFVGGILLGGVWHVAANTPLVVSCTRVVVASADFWDAGTFENAFLDPCGVSLIRHALDTESRARRCVQRRRGVPVRVSI